VQLRGELAEQSKRLDIVSRNQIDFANQVESIKADIAKLRGQIEVLTHELEAAQKRQKDFYVDLDNRLRKLEQPPVEAKVEAPEGRPGPGNAGLRSRPGGAQAAKFKEAATAFIAFIKTYPTGSLAASAHYWGAYAHTQAKDHAARPRLFGKFAAGWPNDERAPLALESRIASLEALKDWKASRATWSNSPRRYPNSEPANGQSCA
jgi:TolA-binding protein